MTFGGLHIGIATKIPPTKAGYFAGGYSGSAILSTVDKITYSTDARTTITARLSSIRQYSSGISNSNTAGYTAGGESLNLAYLSSIDKLIFGVDSISTLSAVLSTSRKNIAGLSNSGNNGYLVGGKGTENSAQIIYTLIEKLSFSDDSLSTISANISNFPYTSSGPGLSNSGIAGYIVGSTASLSEHYSINKLDFSNDTVSLLSSTLSTARPYSGGVSNSGTAGYVIGGEAFSPVFKVMSTVDKFDFSSETFSLLSATISSGKEELAGTSNNGVFGYIGGGQSFPDGGGTVTFLSTVDKLNFSTDSIAALGTNLAARRGRIPAGLSNSGII